MVTQTQIDTHDSIIQDLIDRFEEYIETSSKALENRVADRVTAATTPEELLETRIPINQDFVELIDGGIRDFMGEFDATARDVISWTPGDVTPEDNRVVTELKKQSYNRLTEVSASTREDIHTEILMGALAGVAVQSIAESVRHKVSGLMITTSDLETTRLQNKLKRLRAAGENKSEEINDQMQKLRRRFQNVSVGGNFAQSANAEMHNLVMDFDGVFIRHRGRQAGLKRFKYTGSLVRDSRKFCVSNLDRIFTEEEAKQKWANESWSGKRSGDPFVVRGGHRCRHFWIPVE